MTGRVRTSIYSGTHETAGLYIHPGLIGEDECRKRIVELWRPGTTVKFIAGGYCVRFPHPVLMRSSNAYGRLLIENGDENGDTLFSAPLTKKEKQKLFLKKGALILVHEGIAHSYDLTADSQIAPGTWLDMTPYRELSGAPLGTSPEPARLKKTPPPESPEKILDVLRKEKDVTEILEGLYKYKNQPGTGTRFFSKLATIGLVAVSRLLSRPKGAQSPEKGGRSPSQGGGSPSHGGGSPSQGGWFSRFLSKMRNKQGADSPGPVEPHRETGPGRLRQEVDRLLRKVRISALFHHQHARFIEKMTELFERQEWTEALKHALPLGGGEGGDRPVLGFLKPRQSLNFGRINRTANRGSSQGVLMEQRFFEYLQQLYENSFEKMDQMGKIDKAAYILDSLLNQSQRAVAYLESKGEFRKAAQLAEARELPAQLITRLWFQAGEKERALRIAKNHGIFLLVLKNLEDKDNELAVKWRFFWARELANSGDYAKAVQVAWELPFLAHIVPKWIELAMETGGTMAAEMLAFSLKIRPEHYEEDTKKVLQLLEGREAGSSNQRRVFTEALLEDSYPSSVRGIARETFRALVRDYGRGDLDWERGKFKMLVKTAGGGALSAELPVISSSKKKYRKKKNLLSAQTPLKMDCEHRGTAPIEDACLLENGRMVAALGEAGMVYRSRENHPVYASPLPAGHLVISDKENMVLTLMQRDDSWSISKTDLCLRTSSRWLDVRIDCFARRYDGSSWYVGVRDSLVQLDVHSKEFTAIWSVSDLPGEVRTVAYAPGEVHILLQGEEWQHWSYQLPDHRLMFRNTLKWDIADNGTVNEKGELIHWYRQQEPEDKLIVTQLDFSAWNTEEESHFSGYRMQGQPVSTENWLIIPLFELDTGATVVVLKKHPGLKTYGELQFAAPVRLYTKGTLLYIIEKGGAVFCMDLETGQITQRILN
ncbi:MAG: hypothetical protein GY757_19540 [bacterium]|nr:hypothetical protein [bacterium]